jgi:hypothetical protein
MFAMMAASSMRASSTIIRSASSRQFSSMSARTHSRISTLPALAGTDSASSVSSVTSWMLSGQASMLSRSDAERVVPPEVVLKPPKDTMVCVSMASLA